MSILRAWPATMEPLSATGVAKHAFADFGIAVMTASFGTHFLRAIFSGWLIALMVWMLAGASARAFIVLMVTYLVGLADLSHVIAGSREAFYAVLDGTSTLAGYFTRFLFPVGLGNIVGGSTLVAVLTYAQVSADERS